MKRHLNIQAVEKLIQHYGLDKKTRKREIVSMRYYTYYILKKHTNFSLSKIGSFFDGKDHASILHGLAEHKKHTESNDNIYYECTHEIAEDLDACLELKVPVILLPIEQRILECDNYNEFKRIRAEIRKKLLS